MALTTPVITITLTGREDTPVTIQTDNRDMVRWDLTRGKSKWPSQTEAPMLWVTFIAWAALKRTGGYTDDFDTFNEECLQAKLADEAAAVDPTKAPSEG